SFGGVVWVMWGRLGDDNRPGAMALVGLATVCIVTAALIFKRLPADRDLLVLNGGQLTAAGVALALPSLAWEPLGGVHRTPGFVGAWLYLIAAISWLAMGLWFWLLRHGDATQASAYFFLNPVFGLLLGALFLGEPMSAVDFAATAAVALGIY